MVAGGDAPLAGDAVAEETVGLEERRGGGEDAGAQVERDG
jgi:hypothetical protein